MKHVLSCHPIFDTTVAHQYQNLNKSSLIAIGYLSVYVLNAVTYKHQFLSRSTVHVVLLNVRKGEVQNGRL